MSIEPNTAEPADHPDAALLALGIEIAAVRKRHAGLYDASGITNEQALVMSTEMLTLLTRVIEAKAQTLEGLKVKAQAISWCHASRFAGFARDSALQMVDGELKEGNPTDDFRVLDSLLFDLFALAGEPVAEWSIEL